MSQYSLIAVAAAILLMIVGIRLISSTILRRNPASFALLITAVIWALAQAVVTQAPPGKFRLDAMVVQYTALAWLAPFLVGCAISFGRTRPKIFLVILPVLILLSGLATMVVVTNYRTGWLFSQVSDNLVTGQLDKTHGLLYPFYVGYLILSAIFAIITIAWRQSGRGGHSTKRAWVVIIAFMIPSLVSFIEAWGIFLTPGHSFVPLSLLAAAVTLMWGVTSVDLLSPLSLAQKSIVDSLDVPVIICDRLGGLLYLNPAAHKYAGPGKTLVAAFPELGQFLPVGQNLPSHSVLSNVPVQVRMAEIDWSVYPNINQMDFLEPGTLILVLHNITALAAQAAELEAQVQQRTELLAQTNLLLEAENQRYRSSQNQLEKAVREKEMLLRELHHRVKNNLQIIISLITLQANRSVLQPEAQAICQAMKERIRSISLVHDQMHRESFHDSLDFGAYVAALVTGTAAQFQLHEVPAPVVTLTARQFRASVDFCVDLGLVINELVTNAYKHAILPYGNQLHLDLIETPPNVRLIIRDFGPGLVVASDGPNKGGLGMNIVRSILSKYNMILESGLDGGAWVGINLPVGGDGLQEMPIGS